MEIPFRPIPDPRKQSFLTEDSATECMSGAPSRPGDISIRPIVHAFSKALETARKPLYNRQRTLGCN